MHIDPNDPNELQVVNYVPDEVCVLVSAEVEQHHEDEAEEDAQAFYDFVRARLNTRIAALLKIAASGDRPDRPFFRDTAPDVLLRRFAGNRAILQPLHRSSDRGYARENQLPPFVGLRRPGARSSTQHLFFQLGPDRPRLDRMDDERRRIGLQSVRELVLLLNRFLPGEAQAPFGTRRWVVQAVTPNWLTLAAPMGCGCPAGLPIVGGPERHRWHFRFRGPLARALEQPERGKVVVAVLDTCPTQEAVDAAAARHPANSLLRDVQRTVRMNEPALVPVATVAQHLAGCLPRWQWDMLHGPAQASAHQFAISDHGLFATGIVVDVLRPGAPVHLVRVLNDFGVGDLFAITHALAELPRRLLGSDARREDEPRLVINLSLAIDLPVPARLLDRWFPRTARDEVASREHQPDIARSLDVLHASLQDIVDWLNARGVLVVAAAGNDALRRDLTPGEPPPPRFPARYDNVLGVASMRRDLRSAANYSNRGDLATGSVPGDVGSFGGNVLPAATPDAPNLTEADDSIVGIFSSRTLPGTGETNTSGWVRWAGTSFSTPIVSAVAARLWAADPDLTPMDVLARVRGFARDPHGGPDPESPLEVPVLEVAQA